MRDRERERERERERKKRKWGSEREKIGKKEFLGVRKSEKKRISKKVRQ